MLHFTDPSRLGNKEGSLGNTQISLGRRSRRNLVSRLRTGGDRNMNNQVWGWLGRILTETSVKG